MTLRLPRHAGKLGDERALYYMESALNEPFLDYFNYTAVKNAMEEIAGKEFPEKEFPGDELYERMMQEEQ